MISLLLCGWAVAQTKSAPVPDQRIYEAYDQATIEHLLATSPRTIEYYNFFLTESYYIEEVAQEKVHDLEGMEEFTLKHPAVGEVPDFSPEGLKNLNVLRFSINISPIGGAMYRLGNTNKIIVFYPGQVITENFKKYLNSK